jgi:hypothetical protein
MRNDVLAPDFHKTTLDSRPNYDPSLKAMNHGAGSREKCNCKKYYSHKHSLPHPVLEAL